MGNNVSLKWISISQDFFLLTLSTIDVDLMELKIEVDWNPGLPCEVSFRLKLRKFAEIA